MYNEILSSNNKSIYYQGHGYIFIELVDKTIIKFRLSIMNNNYENDISELISKNNTDMYYLKLLKNNGYTIPDNFLVIKKNDESKYFISLFCNKNINGYDYIFTYRLIECIFINDNCLKSLLLSNQWSSNHLHKIHTLSENIALDRLKYYLYFDGENYIAKNYIDNTIQINQNEVKVLLFDIMRDTYIYKLTDTIIETPFEFNNSKNNKEWQ